MHTEFVVLAATVALLAACTTRVHSVDSVSHADMTSRPAAPVSGGPSSARQAAMVAAVGMDPANRADDTPGSATAAPAQAPATEPGPSTTRPSAPASRPAKPFAVPKTRAPAALDARALNEALTAVAHHCDAAAHDLLADYLHGRPGARTLPLTTPRLRVEQGWKVYRALPRVPLEVRYLPVREVALLQLPDMRRTGLSIGFDAPLERARVVLEDLQQGVAGRPELLVEGGRAVIYCGR